MESTDATQASSEAPGLVRRTVIVAGAWAVPAIVLASAVPAASASGDLTVTSGNPFVNPWIDDDLVLEITLDGSPLAAGAVSVTSAGNVFENEPVTAPIEDGWSSVPLRPVAPATGDVVLTVVVTTPSGPMTRFLTVTIQSEPGGSVGGGSGSGTEGDPLLIAAGASSASYVESGGSWTQGPRVELAPYVDSDTTWELTDQNGVLDPDTFPATGSGSPITFFPLGDGGVGDGMLRLSLSRNGYTAEIDYDYSVFDAAFIVHGPLSPNHIDFFAPAPFHPPLVIRIDNGRGGVLAGAEVSIADQSGKFDGAASSFGPHLVNSIGRIEPSWVPLDGATGPGIARFTIVNGAYSKTVDVTYTIP